MAEPTLHSGSTGEAVIGTARELEGVPAMSILATSLPGGSARVHNLSVRDTGDGPAVEVPTDLSPPPGEPMLLLADPYTFPADAFLDGVSARFGGALTPGARLRAAEPEGARAERAQASSGDRDRNGRRPG